uniref:Uncharacterized protein n=1 Tax=Rhizophora mucronata TaxID=61149 RepID=A0A2P2IX76_RHIMU
MFSYLLKAHDRYICLIANLTYLIRRIFV